MARLLSQSCDPLPPPRLYLSHVTPSLPPGYSGYAVLRGAESCHSHTGSAPARADLQSHPLCSRLSCLSAPLAGGHAHLPRTGGGEWDQHTGAQSKSMHSISVQVKLCVCVCVCVCTIFCTKLDMIMYMYIIPIKGNFR